MCSALQNLLRRDLTSFGTLTLIFHGYEQTIGATPLIARLAPKPGEQSRQAVLSLVTLNCPIRLIISAVEAMTWFEPQIEYAAHRRMRTRNTRRYRAAHWPIWIWVFFLVPGPLVFDLFARGGSTRNWIWLGIVLAGTGISALRGKLPGAEPAPYILRFDEDRPNPLYRRVCYTFAWNALLSFMLLNLAGLVWAVLSGHWYLKQIYSYGYFPLTAVILALGLAGALPRVGRSTRGEGIERRYFYGAVWAVTLAQTTLMVLWKLLPPGNHQADLVKLIAFVGVLIVAGSAAAAGRLPRTRPILPGELMVAD